MAQFGTDTRTMVKGDTYNFTVTVRNAVTGVVQDIGSWTAFRAMFKQNVSDTDVQAIITKTLGSGITKSDAPNGQITVKINPADTTGLDWKPYSLYYDVQGIDGNADTWTLVQGRLLINPDISRTSP